MAPPIVCEPALVTKSEVSGSLITPVLEITPSAVILIPVPELNKALTSALATSMSFAFAVIPYPPTTPIVLVDAMLPPPDRPSPAEISTVE